MHGKLYTQSKGLEHGISNTESLLRIKHKIQTGIYFGVSHQHTV